MWAFQCNAVMPAQRLVPPMHLKAYTLQGAKPAYGKWFGRRSGYDPTVCINEGDIAYPTVADRIEVDTVVSRFLKNMTSVLGFRKLDGQVLDANLLKRRGVAENFRLPVHAYIRPQRSLQGNGVAPHTLHLGSKVNELPPSRLHHAPSGIRISSVQVAPKGPALV